MQYTPSDGNPGDDAAVARALATLRLIGFALLAGAAVFALIALIAGGPSATAQQPLQILRLVWAGMMINAVIVPLVARRTAVQKLVARPQPASNQVLAATYSALTIMSLAMVEAPSLLGGVILLLSGKELDLALAGAPLLGMPMLVAHARWERFVSDIQRGRELGQNFDRQDNAPR